MTKKEKHSLEREGFALRFYDRARSGWWMWAELHGRLLVTKWITRFGKVVKNVFIDAHISVNRNLPKVVALSTANSNSNSIHMQIQAFLKWQSILFRWSSDREQWTTNPNQVSIWKRFHTRNSCSVPWHIFLLWKYPTEHFGRLTLKKWSLWTVFKGVFSLS